MFDALRRFFSFEREYDETQNLARGFGWFRGLNIRGEFLGWVFVCPGSVQKATVAAPQGYRDTQGNPVTEVPVSRHIGCGFQSYAIPPGLSGIENVEATCPRCRQHSRLSEWLRLNGYKKLEDVPSRSVAPASAYRPRFVNTWNDPADPSRFSYEPSNAVPGVWRGRL